MGICRESLYADPNETMNAGRKINHGKESFMSTKRMEPVASYDEARDILAKDKDRVHKDAAKICRAIKGATECVNMGVGRDRFRELVRPYLDAEKGPDAGEMPDTVLGGAIGFFRNLAVTALPGIKPLTKDDVNALLTAAEKGEFADLALKTVQIAVAQGGVELSKSQWKRIGSEDMPDCMAKDLLLRGRDRFMEKPIRPGHRTRYTEDFAFPPGTS